MMSQWPQLLLVNLSPTTALHLSAHTSSNIFVWRRYIPAKKANKLLMKRLFIFSSTRALEGFLEIKQILISRKGGPLNLLAPDEILYFGHLIVFKLTNTN